MDSNSKWQNIVVLYQNQGTSTKGDRRVQQIVEQAVELIAKSGYENLDFVKLAKKCKITRPLISHYFPNKESLLLAVVQYVGLRHQEFLLNAMPKAARGKELLHSYVAANLNWPLQCRSHARVWMHYLALAAIQDSEKSENTRSVDNGAQRILSILKQDIHLQKIPDQALELKAKTIQLLITGTVISLITEHRSTFEAELMTRATLSNLGLLLQEEWSIPPQT